MKEMKTIGTFYLNASVLAEFKRTCSMQKRSASSVVNSLMLEFVEREHGTPPVVEEPAPSKPSWQEISKVMLVEKPEETKQEVEGDGGTTESA